MDNGSILVELNLFSEFGVQFPQVKHEHSQYTNKVIHMTSNVLSNERMTSTSAMNTMWTFLSIMTNCSTSSSKLENIGSRIDMQTHAGNGRSSTRH